MEQVKDACEQCQYEKALKYLQHYVVNQDMAYIMAHADEVVGLLDAFEKRKGVKFSSKTQVKYIKAILDYVEASYNDDIPNDIKRQVGIYQDRYDLLEPTLRTEATLTQYSSQHNMLVKYIVKQPIEWIQKHPIETIDAIKSFKYDGKKQYTDKTIKTYIAYIMFSFDKPVHSDLLRYYNTFYDEFNTRRREIENEYKKNETPQKVKDAYVSWSNIIKRRDEIGQGKDRDGVSMYGSKRHLILSLYTYLNPVRQDFHRVKIYGRAIKQDKAEPNYIVINKDEATLWIREHKTSKSEGTIELKLPKELVNILKASLTKEPRQWLFVGQNGKPYNNDKTGLSSFTKVINEHLSRALLNKETGFGVTILRRIFISYFRDSRPSQIEREEVAHQMGHSEQTQDLYDCVDLGKNDTENE